ncbi:ATP-binding cassette domain-containing protein, partial [Cronobacter malonaticus]|uniref:ATP-binding cassette domain-containing protein n=1 Tax=Cronobacter malonaticus TaxID=413503 RepID=UPI001F472F04
SLNPVKTIGDQVAEVLALHTGLSRRARDAEVAALLARVGLSEPALRAKQYPHQLSGGMKQRVLIAIALSLNPVKTIGDQVAEVLALHTGLSRRARDAEVAA